MSKQLPVVLPVGEVIRAMLKALANRPSRDVEVLVPADKLVKFRASMNYWTPVVSEGIKRTNQDTYHMMGMEDMMTYIEYVNNEGIKPLNKIKSKVVDTIVHDNVTYKRVKVYEISVSEEVAAELPQYIIVDED